MRFSLPIVVFLVVCSIFARAQSNSVVVDTTGKWRVEVPVKNGKWNGLAKYYNKSNGTLFAEFTFAEGKMSGPAVYYDEETGCKQVYGVFKDSARVGEWLYWTGCPEIPDGKVVYAISSDTGHTTAYYASGNIIREGNMKDGEMDGVWRAYYDAPGKLHMISNKCFSKNNGEAVLYDSLTQKVVKTGKYKCDIEVGLWEVFDPNTSLPVFAETYNDNGELDGPFVEYFASGKKKEEGQYSNGLKQGVFRGYDSATGTLEEINTYLNDTLDGKVQSYYPSGKLYMDGYYKMGVPYGFWTGYHQDGTTRYSAVHEKLTGIAAVKYYATNGVLTSTGKMVNENKDGEWTFYDREGRGELQKVEEFKNGMQHGAATHYYPGKKIKAKGEHKGDLPHGKWKRYYPSGKLWLSMEYDHSRFVGELKSYYENGKLRRKEEYDNGKLVSSVCYSEDGQEVAYTSIYKQASYDGDLTAYFRENMVRPNTALKDDEDGKVTVSINIEDNGKILVLGVKSTLPDEYDREAVRLVQAMKNLKPATLDGFPISVDWKIVVPFK